MGLEALSAAQLVVATFHPGASPAGHHWEITDQDGAELYRTKRVHSGGAFKRAAWKAVTLTGLDSGNDIHVQLRDGSGETVARISSENARPAAIVTATGPAGETIARCVHERDGLHLDDGITVPIEAGADDIGPWPVLGADGASLGELVGGMPGPSTTPTWSELLIPYAPNQSSDFARTMHLGVRRAMRYALKPAGRPSPAVALLPLLAGLTY
jgi:hypothetical protein